MLNFFVLPFFLSLSDDNKWNFNVENWEEGLKFFCKESFFLRNSWMRRCNCRKNVMKWCVRDYNVKRWMWLCVFFYSTPFYFALLIFHSSSFSSVMACSANQGNPETAQSVYEFTVNDIKGEPVSLEKYKGHVLIIVNVASKCGYTAKHYAELNEIYDQYAESKGEFLLSRSHLYS